MRPVFQDDLFVSYDYDLNNQVQWRQNPGSKQMQYTYCPILGNMSIVIVF